MLGKAGRGPMSTFVAVTYHFMEVKITKHINTGLQSNIQKAILVFPLCKSFSCLLKHMCILS